MDKITELKTELVLYGWLIDKYELIIMEDIDYNKIEDETFYIDIDLKLFCKYKIYTKFLRLQIYRLFGENSKIDVEYNAERGNYRIVITRRSE